MSHLIPLLREALASGTVRVELGRIAGHCGYLDPHRRAVTLNPDATDDEWVAELDDQLSTLIEQHLARTTTWRPPALVHSANAPEDAPPAHEAPAREQVFRVVG